VFQPSKRYSDYQGHRGTTQDRSGIALPVLVGAGMIAAAILLSTLVNVVSTRFVGIDSPSEETVWLIDRLTGQVYRCQAAEQGRAACDAETATGSISGRTKR
jgi:hypothetical protein